jgi:hypothetical protein
VVSENFRKVVDRAGSEPAFRGKMIWFPEQVCEEYGLVADEARAVRTGELSGLDLTPELARKATNVFDTHDLHSGE